MPKRRLLEGKLFLKKDLTDVCWSTPLELVKFLLSVVGLQFPVPEGVDFVVYGFQTPSADQKGKLWVRTDHNDHFVGFFQFIGGNWKRIETYSNDVVVWKYGDSRVIADGFQLIDGTVQAIPVEVQQHIMAFYKENEDESAPGFPVYSYFATIYLGI